MTETTCNYQRKVTVKEVSEALLDATCQHCGISTGELMLKGELLEICAEEFASDITNGDRVLVPIALCPACHRRNHLDAGRKHNPCQIKARLSREGLA